MGSPVERLTRPKKGRILGGVCAGIGNYFDVDPVIIRILWVVLTLISLGAGIIAYIIAWIIIPEEEEGIEFKENEYKEAEFKEIKEP